ncbi:hypothetical protein CHLRE_17g715421v5 [Chlamydomonas reinhardtii]|uniref:Uncharacterized protein n=1 Tax=Chlamydomonas reinhardtii TaxID=3055 RepID=A0A2K3CPX0_CHLRE|nr:uncharacterized protein CHLRE_17g715421v5 [Chlamydomonas reinhardtii]PNW70329.1 hypothetical protein CHLRE_17g715421v5 [Chlamydomonas reinhardtii]
MEYAHNLLDVLRVLPVDARAAAFGESFSRRLAGCRLACRELQQLHDSSITRVRLQPPAEQQPGLASPLAKFTRCSRLDVRCMYNPLKMTFLARGSWSDLRNKLINPINAALAGTTFAAREQITHFTSRGWASNRCVAQAVAAQLPSLEVLELVCSEGFGACNQQGGICRILGGGLPNLQRLTLAQATEADLADLGALAACPQLRELDLCKASMSGRITRAALEGLAQLQRLEHLRLSRSVFTGSSESEQLLTWLLTSHRPPQLRTLVLVCQDQTPVLEVGFAPRVGAVEAEVVGWGISRIQLSTDQAGRNEPVLVSALLAAADSLKQLTIPQLAICDQQSLWRLDPIELEPQAALPRLLARCERVEVDCLPSIRTPFPSYIGIKPVLLSAARLMGLPRVLNLRHGNLLCRDTVIRTSGEAPVAVAAAASTAAQQPGGRELGLMLQQLDLGSGTWGGHRSGSAAASDGDSRRLLHLDTASPQDVSREAAEWLWAEAVLASSACCSSDRCEGAASGSSGGDHVSPSGLLLLRGTLPPAPEHASRFGGMDEPDWAYWLEDVLSSWFTAAALQPTTPDQEPAIADEGQQRLPDSIRGCICDGVHIVVPEAGMLLLECRSDADALALAAMVSAAGGAASLSAVAASSPVARSSAVNAFRSGVLQVLTGLWARSGAADNAGGGGGSSMGVRGGSRVSEEVMGRLERLVALDRAVMVLQVHLACEGNEELVTPPA